MSGAGSLQENKKSILGEVTVYTTLPMENVTYLAEAYEREYSVKVNFIPVSIADVQEEIKATGKADMLLTDSRILTRAAGEGWLVPYSSEHGDSVSDNFKDANGYWIGTWYDPVVFCINKDYMQRMQNLPLGWQALAISNNLRIGITDFLAADSAADMYFFLVMQFGEAKALELLRNIHPHVAQYAKYLSTPARMAGMGEADIGITVQSEVLRYIEDGYPLKIIHPEEGTAYTLLGTGILLDAPHSEQAKEFADWLLTDDALLILQSNKFYFVPTNPTSLASKRLAVRSPILFGQIPDFPQAKKQELLDKWVKNVRINTN